MTITTKENAAGRISAYYVDGVKTRKGEVEGAIYEAARNGEIIYVDYYTGQEFKSIVCSCYRNMKVVFTSGTHGAHLMTESAAEDLGWRIIKEYGGAYCGLTVCKVEEMTDEEKINAASKKLNRFIYEITSQGLTTAQAEQLFIAKTLGATDEEFFNMANEFKTANDTDANIDDYAVSTDAQDVAIEAEENLADAITAETKTVVEADVEDYAVTTGAQDVATNAEIELANNTTAATKNISDIIAKTYNKVVSFEEGLAFMNGQTLDEYRAEKIACEQAEALATRRARLNYLPDEIKLTEEFTDRDTVLLKKMIDAFLHDIANGYTLTDDDNACLNVYVNNIANGVKELHALKAELATLNAEFGNTNEITTEEPANEATDAEIKLATNATVTSNKLKIQQDAISKDVQAAPVDIPNTFEVGKIYHLSSYVRKCNLKVIKRSSTYLTFSVLNDHGQETDLTERYKIHSNRESEFVNVNTISKLSTELYATNLVADFEKNSVKTPAVTNGAGETANVESTSEENAPVEDFAAQLAAFKVARDAAEADFEQKISARKAAEKAEELAADTFHDAQRAYEKFGNDKAKELRNKLITSDIRATNKLLIYDQSGSVYCPALKYLDICFINDKFEIRCDKEASCIVYKFATYDTPEQVAAAISQLKAAIKHGDKQFKFPTVGDLNQPLTLPPNIKDSLQRAMQIAFDKYKDFCRTGQLTRAEHELKLYNICRRAKIQLSCGNDQPPTEFQFKPPVKAANTVDKIFSEPEEVLSLVDCLTALNNAAPEGWEVTFDGKAFPVKYKGEIVATLDSLATAKALPPDKFFAQFTPLVDKDFEPKKIFLQDLYRERAELLAMRDELPDDSDRIPTIDAMIEQLDRDIVRAEFDEYERTGIPQWF